jgi:phospholipid-binding lipoprotein MlaA
MRSTTRITLLSLCLLLLWGCATLPPGAQRDPRDPFERLNRTSYKVNDALDRAIVKPTAKGYAKLPQPIRNGFYNFFNNFGYPMVIVNDLLQGQVKPFFSDIGRFVLNSTLGLGGFLDPATPTGMERNDRDLGQTLGKWGVPPGPYLVVPIFGPYDVRDGLGAVADDYANPRHYLPFWWQTGLWAAQGVDTRSRLLYLDQTLQNTYDPYAFVRNAYLQHRQFMVGGAESKNEEDQEQKLLEEIGEGEGTAPQGTPGQPAPPQEAPPPPPPQPQGAPPPSQPPPH